MNTVNKALLGALGVQVALALFTNWPSSGQGEARDLLGFAPDQVQSVTITGRKAHDEVPEAPVVLTRSSEGWVITSAEDYPAKDDLVQPVLDALGMLKVHLPVATSAESQMNLEVADDAYTRMLEVTSKDGQTRKLYLGAGQGKTTHVRVDGEKEVYDADGFTAWGVSENANRYFDRDFLKADVGSVTALSVHRPNAAPMDFIKGSDGTWTVSVPLPPGGALDQNLTGSYIASVLNARMIEPAGKTVKPEMGLDGPEATVVTWTVTPPPPQASAEGEAPTAGAPVTASYRIGGEVPGKSGRYYLKSDTSPFVYEMLKSNVVNALEKPIEKLLVGAAPDPVRPPPGAGMGPDPHGGH